MKQPAINMRLPQAALVPVTTHVEAMIPSSRNKITKAACGKPRPVIGQCRKPTAHSSTFGFCRHSKPKQKTKRA